MKKNLGPIYRTKKEKADQAQQELGQTLAANLPMITELESNIQNLEQKIQTEITTLDPGMKFC